jgi:branched-subunit amino acid permease
MIIARKNINCENNPTVLELSIPISKKHVIAAILGFLLTTISSTFITIQVLSARTQDMEQQIIHEQQEIHTIRKELFALLISKKFDPPHKNIVEK